MQHEFRMRFVAVKATSEHVELLVDRGDFPIICDKNGDIVFDVLKASPAYNPPVVCHFCHWVLENNHPGGRNESPNCFHFS
jgi:hypothetical protein